MAFTTPCWMAAKSLTADLKVVKRPAFEAFATVISAGSIVMQSSKSAGHVAPCCIGTIFSASSLIAAFSSPARPWIGGEAHILCRYKRWCGYLDEVKPQDVAKRNERDRGTGIQARRVSNTELNPRRVSSGFLEDPHRSMGARRAPWTFTHRSSIPPRRTLENGH